MTTDKHPYKQIINAEDIDLSKLGWDEAKTDKQMLSYIRGYVWRNYKIKIKPPIDQIIYWMIDGALTQVEKQHKKEWDDMISKKAKATLRECEEIEKLQKGG